MFGADKTALTIAIDSTSKPFWTTGDVITGSIRVMVHSKLMLSGIFLSLTCDEIGVVATEERNREIKNRTKPKKARGVTKKTINHYKSEKQVTGSLSESASQSSSNRPMTLEPGEYVFPFAVDIEDDVNACPPHAPINTRGNIDLGVFWQLKVVIRRWSKLHNNTTASQYVPIHPRNIASHNTRGLIAGNPPLSELSGQDPIDLESVTLGNIFKRKKRPAPLSLEANLKFPSREIPQGPKQLQLRLFLKLQGPEAENQDIGLHSVSIYILRKCDCRIGGKRDTYLTRHLIGSVTASRKVTIAPMNLTSLIGSFGLQEVMPSSFSAKMISLTYELLLTVEYSSPVDNKLRVFELSTPTNITAPYLCWIGSSLPLNDTPGPQVSFGDIPKSRRSRSVATTGSGTTGNTGTTGTTYSSLGTVNSYDIRGPTQVLSSWLASWKP